MKSITRIFIILFIAACTNLPKKQNDPKDFSKQEVLKDMDTLISYLKDAHYNAFAYVSEQDFDRQTKRIKSSITNDSLSYLETFNLYQRVMSICNTGHAELGFPGRTYRDYASAGGTVFPLDVVFENRKTIVRTNLSTNPSIKKGTELLSINGVPMEEILTKLNPHISAERPYFKRAKMEFYSLPRLYWQIFGESKSFKIEIKDKNQITQHTVFGITVIEGFETKRSNFITGEQVLKFFPNTAYLKPGDFGGVEENFQYFIDSAFVDINKKRVQNLIIDLRNNQGGNDSFSDYLVSYIANKPFYWNSKFTLKSSKVLKDFTRRRNDTTQAYFKEILERKDGEVYEHTFEAYQPQPKEKRFHGKVYALINRHSYSQASVTAAQLQDYGFATLVGEETGDAPTLYASIFDAYLPNTNIGLKIPKGYMIRVNGNETLEGVVPDIVIKDVLLDEKDEILEGILQKIE